MKIFVFFAKILATILLLGSILYLTLVHPNDMRIAPYHFTHPLKNDRSWMIQKRFFRDRMAHSLDIVEADYQALLEKVAMTLPAEADTKSTRFFSSKEIYLPVGKYPFRLDGRDALFLPKGAHLRIEPQLKGEVQLRTALWAPDGSAHLSFSTVADRRSQDLKYNPPTTELDTHSFWYKFVAKWFTIDPRPGKDFHGWSEGTMNFSFQDGGSVEISCQGSASGCFIADPLFLQKSDQRHKNLILILVDTLRRDGVDPRIAPNISRFAGQSVDFIHALSPGNMTSPSTNALLSCRLPTEVGGWSFAYGLTREERNDIYRHTPPSFPQRLFDAGYDTAMIGSVSVLSELYGVGVYHGFGRQIAIETDGVDTAQITREAQGWLEQNADHQFFLYIHLNAPHGPYKAPLQDIFAVWPGMGVWQSYASILRWLYNGEVHYTDRYVAKILGTLDQLGLASNTVVALTADHGDQMESRNFSGNEAGQDFFGAYFDHGATLLNDEINVPLIIRDPTKRLAYQVKDYVSTLDLGPTLLELGGVSESSACSGVSLVPDMQGKGSAHAYTRIIGSEGYQGRAILFRNRFKYIRSYEPTQKKIHKPQSYIPEPSLYFVKDQLFDLERDPDEGNNLALGNQSLLREAKALYRSVYHVKDGWELIIESPDRQRVEGEFPSGVHLKVNAGIATLRESAKGVQILADGQSQLVFSMTNWDGKSGKVRIGGKDSPLLRTGLRLPLTVDPKALPAESSGVESLIPYPRDSAAYVRRVEDPGREERKIRTTNPAFESVLREWGYLNDR